ncbi:MAG: hypothetical protein PHD51_02025 [Patescibacteria group bacterium]|nr:hypothetical protein [Patescibacteria group bacterium]MDD5490362.1 hypothetical protein [Patescibacteria group bacterium]
MEIVVRTAYGEKKFDAVSLENTNIFAVIKPRAIKNGGETIEIGRGTILIPNLGNYQFFPYGAYEALRSKRTAVIGYGKTKLSGGEKKELGDIINDLREAVADILRFSSLSDEEKEKINKSIENLYLRLSKSRNLLKNEARDYIEKSFDVIDSLGRINPSATSAKLSAARARLEARIKEVYRISEKLHFWETILLQTIKESVGVFDETEQFTSRILNSKEAEFFSGQKEIIEDLRKFKAQLDNIKVAPFSATAYYCELDLSGALSAFLNEDYEGFRQKISLTRNGALCKLRQRDLERIIWWFKGENLKGIENRKEFFLQAKEKVKEFEKGIKGKISDEGFIKKVFTVSFWNRFDSVYEFLSQHDFETAYGYLKSISHDL